jgi:hypothetical protein
MNEVLQCFPVLAYQELALAKPTVEQPPSTVGGLRESIQLQ